MLVAGKPEKAFSHSAGHSYIEVGTIDLRSSRVGGSQPGRSQVIEAAMPAT